MAVLIRRTGIWAYPEEAVVIDHDDLQAGLKRGEYEHVEADIYRETAQYQTKVMEPAPVKAPQAPVEPPVAASEPESGPEGQPEPDGALDAPDEIRVTKGGPWYKITVPGHDEVAHRGAEAAREYLVNFVDEAEADRLLSEV